MTPDKSDAPTPTISRVCPDGTLIELLYDSIAATTSLAVRAPDGTVAIESQVDLATGERLVPYTPGNNLLTSGCVLLPSNVGALLEKPELLAQIKSYIHRYVDLPELYEDIAAHYVLLTWVHDAFNELGYLRFKGMPGSGKTRALLAIGSISYKPIFASGASTVSPIFHLLDAFGGTLILDEADLRFSDATADLTKILNNGTMKGLPVLRTMTNRHRELNPQAFKVFGPKIIAMRESFADDALESRFLTHDTGGRTLRKDISIHLPDAMKTEAQALRNSLLAWRFYARSAVAPNPSRLIDDITPRSNQTVLALLSLIDDPRIRGSVADDLVASEARVSTKRAASPEATMVRILSSMFANAATPYLTLADVTVLYNDVTAIRGELPLSAKAVGWMVRGKLGVETTKTRGVSVIPQSERGKIDSLAMRYGLPADVPIMTPKLRCRGFLARSAKISA
ncbi:hypothetical protein [Sphingomonas sp.]|jgi:hypothetical protein|uniref:hypothetical protein n=1 Tax=Sphingomonas sp. TaxID=28214 RepID=UPI002ED8162E